MQLKFKILTKCKLQHLRLPFFMGVSDVNLELEGKIEEDCFGK
jgi:hypothetical protein